MGVRTSIVLTAILAPLFNTEDTPTNSSKIPVLSSSSQDQDLSGLVLVHLVYRHGDRTPINPYPTDPYRNRSNWPVDFGQLTSKGVRQQFELGEWIRERYQGFISRNYSNQEILVRSTDVDRTIMSAQANLAGLYPASGYWNWNTNLPWHPVPVHTVPKQGDRLLSSHAECPRFEELREEVKAGKFMKDIYDDNKELFDYISEKSGVNITDIVQLDYIYDSLLIEDIYEKELPEWTKEVFPGGKFKELRDLSFTVNTLTQEMRRLKGGPFVQEMLAHFQSVVDKTLDPPNRKLFMYSGHDTTVAPILHTLGVFNNIAPPYASMVIVELFEREEFLVRVSYRNETSHPPYILTIPGCSHLCSLKKFKELTASIIPVDWKSECGFTSADGTTQQVTLVAAIVASIMAGTVLVVTVRSIFCKKKEVTNNTLTARYHRVEQMEVET